MANEFLFRHVREIGHPHELTAPTNDPQILVGCGQQYVVE